MNILAFGAHPDDIETFCAGTLLKCAARGDSIYIALTTSGDTGSNEIPTREEVMAVREAEQLASAKLYGAQVRFLRFPDEGLSDTPETRRAVLTAIRWADPDVILTNPPWDRSPDHGMTGKLVTEVLLSVGGKLHPADLPPIDKAPSVFFFTTSMAVDFEPDIYVDITPYIETKIEARCLHKSQAAWLGEFTQMASDAERSRILSRYFGIRCGCQYAEGFVAHQILGFAPNYKLLP